MNVINYRKNIAKALHQEYIRRKQLKSYKAYEEGDIKSIKEELLQCETRIRLLKDLQQPLKSYYSL